MHRRSFLKGLAGILASGVAPAVLPSGIIMPVRQLVITGKDGIDRPLIWTFESNPIGYSWALKLFEDGDDDGWIYVDHQERMRLQYEHNMRLSRILARLPYGRAGG